VEGKGGETWPPAFCKGGCIGLVGRVGVIDVGLFHRLCHGGGINLRIKTCNCFVKMLIRGVFISIILISSINIEVLLAAESYYEYARNDNTSFVIMISDQDEGYGPYGYRIFRVNFGSTWDLENPQSNTTEVTADLGEGYSNREECFDASMQTLSALQGDNTTFMYTGQNNNAMYSSHRTAGISVMHVEALIGLLFALIFIVAFRWYL